MIDPGHGGKKPGAIGKKSKEKDITLSIALKLGETIKANFKDVTVLYTRDTDVDIDLAERAQMANRAKADLFISIHANSHKKTEPSGTETFSPFTLKQVSIEPYLVPKIAYDELYCGFSSIYILSPD